MNLVLKSTVLKNVLKLYGIILRNISCDTLILLLYKCETVLHLRTRLKIIILIHLTEYIFINLILKILQVMAICCPNKVHLASENFRGRF